MVDIEREFMLSNKVMLLLYTLLFVELTPWLTFKLILNLFSLLFLLSLMELAMIFYEYFSSLTKVFKR